MGEDSDEDDEDETTTLANMLDATTEAAMQESALEDSDVVGEKPVITAQASMIQKFTIGEPFVLICAASSDTPLTFYWTKNGRFLNIDDPVNQV